MSDVVAVVPTAGGAAWLDRCLEALRRQPGLAEIVVVRQGAGNDPGGVRVERLPAPVGFARAVNHGIRSAAGAEWIAVVNDDAVVAPGWLEALLATLRARPTAAAAQGVNLAADGRVDGAGIAWNRWWQAVQRGVGEAPPEASAAPQEVFGVSATAALYRAAALAEVAFAAGPFDPALDTYYEDVELAVRLAGRGWTSWLVPRARAEHAGGASRGLLGRRAAPLLVANRLLVTARLLGRGWWPRLPLLLARDVADAVRAPGTAPAVARGWGRAIHLLPRFAHAGPPRVGSERLSRFCRR